VTEKENERQNDIVIETEVEASDVPMSGVEIAQQMSGYRERHPEEFAGTPEWIIKVTAENAARVYKETGILFHIM
jgi:hypothetical protein